MPTTICVSKTEKQNGSCDVGSIFRKEGVIKAVEKLVCKSCKILIPNCFACDSASNCVMCDEGYRQAFVKDAFLKTNVVCLKDICGFYGKGSRCTNNVGLEGCDKSVIVDIKDTLTESCERCSPGYYKVTKIEKTTNIKGEVEVKTASCNPINQKLSLRRFVASYDSK